MVREICLTIVPHILHLLCVYIWWNKIVNEELLKFENGLSDEELCQYLSIDSISPPTAEVAAIIAAVAATSDIVLAGCLLRCRILIFNEKIKK